MHLAPACRLIYSTMLLGAWRKFRGSPHGMRGTYLISAAPSSFFRCCWCQNLTTPRSTRSLVETRKSSAGTIAWFAGVVKEWKQSSSTQIISCSEMSTRFAYMYVYNPTGKQCDGPQTLASQGRQAAKSREGMGKWRFIRHWFKWMGVPLRKVLHFQELLCKKSAELYPYASLSWMALFPVS